MYETQLYVSCHMGVYRHAYIRVCFTEVRGSNLFLGKSACTIFLITNLLIRAEQSFVRHSTFWKVQLFSEIVSESSWGLQLSYKHNQRGHKTQKQSQRLMSVKTKGQNHQSPESQPCPPYSIPNESNHSSSSVNTEVEPWIHPGWVRAPQDHIRPPGSDPVLMDDSSGTRDRWAASRLPLSLWFVHLQAKTHTCTQKGYVQLGCDLVRDHTLKWPCFWWVVSHGGGRREKGG